MRNGMYLVGFTGSHGQGYATLTIKDGSVFGFDETGAEYDGTCLANPANGMTHVTMKVKMKAGIPTVAGGIALPHDWILTVSTVMPSSAVEGNVLAKTSVGVNVAAHFRCMRELPLAA